MTQTKHHSTKNKIQTRLDGLRIKNPLIFSKYSQQCREETVKEANRGSLPTQHLKARYGQKGSEEIITFEHINVNGINPHDGLIELTNTLGIFKSIGAGFYGINEHNLNTSDQLLMKKFWETSKKLDKFSRISISSNIDEKFKSHWQPGGAMLGCDGKWAGRAAQQGDDKMGRWSWMDLQGQAGKTIRVISAYRVSQESPKQVGDLTACKQQYWSYVKQGVKDPNPKGLFLKDLGKFINRWKNISEKNYIILMMDSNESLERGNSLHDFLIDHNLVDAISYLNPTLKNDKTYLYGSKRIDHIFLL